MASMAFDASGLTSPSLPGSKLRDPTGSLFPNLEPPRTEEGSLSNPKRYPAILSINPAMGPAMNHHLHHQHLLPSEQGNVLYCNEKKSRISRLLLDSSESKTRIGLAMAITAHCPLGSVLASSAAEPCYVYTYLHTEHLVSFLRNVCTRARTMRAHWQGNARPNPDSRAGADSVGRKHALCTQAQMNLFRAP